MIIHGINKLTLLDFPGHTACTLFTGGCNFRCPFCQNGSLVLNPAAEPVIDNDLVFEFLKKRKKLLQGVCITGGEPTLNTDLVDFVRQIRDFGYMVKLDTNGSRPEVLQELCNEGLLAGVAMDIKSSPGRYAVAIGMNYDSFDFAPIERSVLLIRDYAASNPGFYAEFRTTMVKGLQRDDDMVEIGLWLEGVENYFLQHYEESANIIGSGAPTGDSLLLAFSKEEMEHMADIVRTYIPNVKIRGI